MGVLKTPTMNKRDLKRIAERFDYQTYVERNLAVRYTPSSELRVCCPACPGGDDKFKLYINKETKKFLCFKCGFNSGKNSVIDFVAKVEGITASKALDLVLQEYPDLTPSWEEIEEDLDRVKAPTRLPKVKTILALPKGVEPLSDPLEARQRPFWDYLTGRGLTVEEVLGSGIHYAEAERLPIYSEAGAYKGNIGRRVIFPVYGGANQLVSWLSRAIDPGKEPKYINCPDSELHNTLWPFVPTRAKTAVLVEGIIDAIGLRRVGVKAYATFGKKISIAQIATLVSWGVETVILFWDKKDAKPEMERAMKELKLHFNRVLVPDISRWPSTSDAGDILANPELGELAADLFTSANLIDVDSFGFTKWQLA